MKSSSLTSSPCRPRHSRYAYPLSTSVAETMSDGAPQLYHYPCLRMFDFLRYHLRSGFILVRGLADRADSPIDSEWHACRHTMSSSNWESSEKGQYCSTWAAAVRIPSVSVDARRLSSGSYCLLVGTEIRKAVFDGWPVTGIIAADLSKGE